MAIVYTSWEHDGNGQAEIKHLRSDVPYFHDIKTAWVEEQSKDPKCVLITKSRTDQQSATETVIWQRPGYDDPCLRMFDSE